MPCRAVPARLQIGFIRALTQPLSVWSESGLRDYYEPWRQNLNRSIYILSPAVRSPPPSQPVPDTERSRRSRHCLLGARHWNNTCRKVASSVWNIVINIPKGASRARLSLISMYGPNLARTRLAHTMRTYPNAYPTLRANNNRNPLHTDSPSPTIRLRCGQIKSTPRPLPVSPALHRRTCTRAGCG